MRDLVRDVGRTLAWMARIPEAWVAVAIASVLLVGCATNADGWIVDKRVDALPAIFVASTAAEIQARCPRVPGAMGCAVRDWNERVCRIYIETPPVPWLAMHELWHCAGWQHAL